MHAYTKRGSLSPISVLRINSFEELRNEKPFYHKHYRLCAFLLVALAFAAGQSAHAQGSFYQQHDLVANLDGAADFTDPNLVNPWGLVFNPFGLAWVADNGTGSLLYAADFHNNKIDVFDGSFTPVTLTADAFTDPNLPTGFAPFGIQAINGSIYVSYAMQDADQHDDVKGDGLGFVNVFGPNGEFIKRLVSQGRLNAPWGMTLAPAGFGEFGNRLLVGNFGNGAINAYDIATGQFAGQLVDTNGSPIRIDGLWGLAFGNGFANQPVNTLFFTAGPNDEQDGLYGRIDVQISATVGQNGTGSSATQNSTFGQ